AELVIHRRESGSSVSSAIAPPVTKQAQNSKICAAAGPPQLNPAAEQIGGSGAPQASSAVTSRDLAGRGQAVPDGRQQRSVRALPGAARRGESPRTGQPGHSKITDQIQ